MSDNKWHFTGLWFNQQINLNSESNNAKGISELSHLAVWLYCIRVYADVCFLCCSIFVVDLFSSSAFPAESLGFSLFLVRFLHIWPFKKNPTVEVVIFNLHGWCILDVFFVVGIHLSRAWLWRFFEYAQTRPRFILSFERVFGDWSQNSCKLQGKKILSTGGSEEGRTHDTASHRTASPKCYRLSYSGPQSLYWHVSWLCCSISVLDLFVVSWLLNVPGVCIVDPRDGFG